ncbi:MAG: Gfo/Idh/MocA family oxidoreductase [Ardenticatenaceae bacterium]|nr:Gfo/Idh/MocA family oxidoreductase [Ardenticatenaceae bacterium]
MAAHRPVGVAVIGTGFGALTHVPGYRACEDVEVLALVGRQPEKSRRVAAELGLPNAATSLDAILDLPGLDLISIATPNANHASESIAALEAGKHVVVDKPMAVDTAEAEAMVAVAERTGLINVVNTELRFNPTRRRMKALVEQGYLGRLYHVSVNSFHDYRPRLWSWKDSAQAGIVRGHGSHMVDLIRWIFGDVEGVVGGVVDTLIPERLDEEGAPRPVRYDDFASFTVRMANGAVGSFLFSTMAVRPKLNPHVEPAYMRVEAFGERGSLFLDLDDRLYGSEPGQAEWTEFTEPEPIVEEPAIRKRVWDLSFVRLARAVTATIRGEGDLGPAATFRDGLAVTRVLDAALRLR